MSSASEVRDLLSRFNLRARKSLGQNFLIDTAALDRIVAAAELTPDDTVLEIGPGLGALTQRLAQAAGRVIAVELDQNLIPALRYTLAAYSNVELVHGDILQLDPATLVTNNQTRQLAGDSGRQVGQYRVDGYKVVANLPYYITSAALRHLLEAAVRPSVLILTLQLEVAQRLAAKPGNLSLLAVSVQFYGKPLLVTRIHAGSFYPVPQVDSAVVRIDVYPHPPAEVRDVDQFFVVVKAGFGQKRKQIHNALKVGLALPAETIAAALRQAGIDPTRRAETLALNEWAALANALRDATKK
ncbi:MAG TPA: 16S rRNA (adenine(1518)-N(6)/adenine(1519)-N(6))-dimethyltransferase RsmA [Anaerolineae bacterium]|nr:16S rRNA (adenine(1518)-N(6)/adenine(1519)-N(6))-dimethyltransferase RsmA [Anaerolineae bacterium]